MPGAAGFEQIRSIAFCLTGIIACSMLSQFFYDLATFILLAIFIFLGVFFSILLILTTNFHTNDIKE